jgi:hypothetical protein
MSNPNQVCLAVPLCEPAEKEVQALAACQYILDALLGDDLHSFERKRMVVAWLAEQFLDDVQVVKEVVPTERSAEDCATRFGYPGPFCGYQPKPQGCARQAQPPGAE